MIDLLKINDPGGGFPNSYYASTVNIGNQLPTLQNNICCQVCVIGAGFTGLSAALSLIELGYEVVVLEANRIGFGASGRNGGQVGSGQRWDQEKLEEKFGAENALAFWQIAEDAKKEVRNRISKHKINCDYVSGVVQAAVNRQDLRDSFYQVDELRKKYNYKALQKLNAQEVSELLNTNFYKGGYLDLGAGHLNPLKFIMGLATAAKRLGMKVFERTKVSKIEYGSKNKLTTETGLCVQSDYLLIACNGYLGNLEPEIASRVMPINNFIIATEPLGERTEEVLTKDIAVADTKFVVNYFRLSKDKRLLFGGGENYSYKFPKNITSTVLRPMLEIFPQLSNVKIDYAWGGTLGITRQRMPYFCRVTDTILSVSGYSGHGLGTATHAGKLISMAINGQQDGFNTMASIPIKSFPGGARYKTPLLILAMSWYALRDKLGI